MHFTQKQIDDILGLDKLQIEDIEKEIDTTVDRILDNVIDLTSKLHDLVDKAIIPNSRFYRDFSSKK